MELQEYKDKLKELIDNFDRDKSLLAKQYAFSNNSYKVGDIVKDNVGSIIIEKFMFTTGNIFSGNNNPECVYFGSELKKDNTPRKDGSKRKIYQSQLEN